MGKEMRKRLLIVFLTGTVPNFLLGMFVTGKLEKLLLFLFPAIPSFLPLIIGAAIGEEVAKCGIAWCFARKLKDGRPIDYIMIFGLTGAGFNLLETLMIGSSIVSVLARSVLALHIIWLYFDGIGYVEVLEGKKLALVRNFLITIFLHFSFDVGVAIIENFDDNMDMTTVGVGVTAIAILLNIIMLVITVRRVWKEGACV